MGIQLVAGGLLLDQSRSTFVRVVRQPVVATRDGTGRVRHHHGALPGDAHVHHERVAEARHEGGWLAIGARSSAREGR